MTRARSPSIDIAATPMSQKLELSSSPDSMSSKSSLT